MTILYPVPEDRVAEFYALYGRFIAGFPGRRFVIDTSDTRDCPRVLINPVLLATSDEMVLGEYYAELIARLDTLYAAKPDSAALERGRAEVRGIFSLHGVSREIAVKAGRNQERGQPCDEREAIA